MKYLLNLIVSLKTILDVYEILWCMNELDANSEYFSVHSQIGSKPKHGLLTSYPEQNSNIPCLFKVYYYFNQVKYLLLLFPPGEKKGKLSKFGKEERPK